eukprot:3617549-Rhodomonas_salina.1
MGMGSSWAAGVINIFQHHTHPQTRTHKHTHTHTHKTDLQHRRGAPQVILPLVLVVLPPPRLLDARDASRGRREPPRALLPPDPQEDGP